MTLFIGIFIPFIGTTLGSACVYFMKQEMDEILQKTLLGFASGVMIAASFWSLLLPALDFSSDLGKMAFIPSSIGFGLGILFLLALDETIPHLHLNESAPEGHASSLKKTTMLLLAVTLHNIPEGMAVGIVLSGALASHSSLTITGALALSIGIAIQNFPEGAIISLPLRAEGMSKTKAFLCGSLSGIVEPIGAYLTVLLSSLVLPYMPYLLSFAAGAMMYVVVEELIPEASGNKHTNLSTIGFAVGFIIMMILDVSLG